MGTCLGSNRARQLREEPVTVEPEPVGTWSEKKVWTSQDNATDARTFDILAIFTSDCIDETLFDYIDQDQLIENIQECVVEMNGAFTASEINLRGRLVAAVRLTSPPEQLSSDRYRDALLGEPANEEERRARSQGVIPDELRPLYEDFQKTCLRLRAQHQAHVLLIVNGGSGGMEGDPMAGCIGASKKGEAFVVVPFKKLLYEYAPAHEIGHLFGCNHDRRASNAPESSPEAHYGYYNDEWRTIMAYNPPKGKYRKVIGHFSNPEVSYNDLVTGAKNANNAEQILLHAPTILGLRG